LFFSVKLGNNFSELLSFSKFSVFVKHVNVHTLCTSGLAPELGKTVNWSNGQFGLLGLFWQFLDNLGYFAKINGGIFGYFRLNLANLAIFKR